MKQTDLIVVKSLLLQALQLPEDERQAFIDGHAEATADQKQETLELLRAHGAEPGLLKDPLAAQLPASEPLAGGEILQEGDIVAERYRIERLISLTANSQVYLASDLRLAGNLVAVKLIPIAAEQFAEYQHQLWREVASLARLHHQSVAGLIDTGLHGPHPFLVTQYCPGLTLDQWVEKEKPGAEARVQLFLHLAGTVESIHRAGLLHLDLKPQNIIVAMSQGGEPTYRILDFGTSVLAGEGVTHRKGTPLYTAPERAEGVAGPASDVYSLGRIGQLMLTDQSAKIQAVLRQALAELPSRRPESAAQLKQRLERVLAGQRRRRWIGRRFLPVAAALAALVFWVRSSVPGERPTQPMPRELTSLRGAEIDPRISADGKTIFFGHEESPFRGTEIHSIPYDGSEGPKALLVPTGTNRYYNPAPSQDGRLLAYLESGQAEINRLHVLDLATGKSRKLADGPFHHVEFGADSRLLYASIATEKHPRGELKLLNTETGEMKSLLAPPTDYADMFPAVSADGRHLAFARFRSIECADLYVVALGNDGMARGELRRITTFDRRLQHPQWLPGGTSLMVRSGSLTSSALYRVQLTDDMKRAASVAPFPEWSKELKDPAVSKLSNRFVAIGEREDCDIYRVPLERKEPMERLVSSTRLEEEPRYSPDGRHIAFISDRENGVQGWLAERSNPTTARRLTSFDMGEKAWPAWSPSGTVMYFARLPKTGPELLAFDFWQPAAKPRRLLQLPHAQRVAGISVDAASVFAEFVPPENPRLERWSMVSDSKELLGHFEARFAREFYRHGRSGERLLLYSPPKENQGLFVLDQGKPRRLYPSLSRRNTFAYHDGFVYLASPDPVLGIYKVNVDTGASTLVTKLDRNPGWGMDVSPDGKELLVALFDFEDSNIVGVELEVPEPGWKQMWRRLVARFR